MSLIKKLLFVLIIFAFTNTVNAQYAAVFEKLKKGVNQDASMAYSGTFEKVQHERAHMKAIKEAGFESVRIFLPFTAGDFTKFEPRIQDALDYDLAVVVCMWGKYYAWPQDIETGASDISAKWGEIAEKWKHLPNDVVFEILNEPKGIGFQDSDNHHAKAMKLYNASIPAIRAADPDRPILVSPPGYNDADKLEPWVTEEYLNYKLADGSGFFDDENMGVAIHFYEPNNGSGTNFAMWKSELPDDDTWKEPIKAEIDHAVAWRENNNTDMPIAVTEWGCWMYDKRTESGDLEIWLDYTMDLFEANDIGSMWYTGIQNNQRAFGIFNSETGWNQVVLDRLTGVTPTSIPATSQIIDAEFLNFVPSNTWKLTSDDVIKSYVKGENALSGNWAVQLSVGAPTDCQMYQRTLIGNEVNENLTEGRALLHLLQGNTYEISFMAKSLTSNGQVKVRLRNNNRGNAGSTIYFDSGTQQVTTITKTYTFYYTHTADTDMDVWFEFDVGAQAQTLILDRAILRRYDQKNSQNAPDAPTLVSKTHNSVTLTAETGIEYSKDGGENWQNSSEFKGLSPNTAFGFAQRRAETVTHKASAASSLLVETTEEDPVKGSQTAPDAPLLASKTSSTVTLIGVTGNEYSKDGINWQSSDMFIGLTSSTTYSFVQRKAETKTLNASHKSIVFEVTTDDWSGQGVIPNPGFEDGIHTGWAFNIVSGDPGRGIYSDAGSADAVSGAHAAKVEVTNPTQINHMRLLGGSSTVDLSGEEVTFSFDSKKQWGEEAAGKCMVRIENAVTGKSLGVTECYYDVALGEDVYQTFELTLDIPANTHSIQVVIWLGEGKGTYFFDNFKAISNGIKESQTITFNALPTDLEVEDELTLEATATSGLAVSFISSNADVATVSGTTLTVVGEGIAVITASQAGNDTYRAAPNVSQTLTVIGECETQTITFNTLPTNLEVGGELLLDATSSSGLTVTYISSNTNVATISGSTLTVVGEGDANITASQTGDDNYCEATTVSQTLTVDDILDGIVNSTITQSLILYPNPATSNITVVNAIKGTEVVIFNVIGNVVLSEKAEAENVMIDISDLQRGMYIVCNGNYVAKVFVK